MSLNPAREPRLLVPATSAFSGSHIALCESGMAELVCSDALEYEAGRNPNPGRMVYALNVLSHARRFVRLSPKIEERARLLNEAGLKPLDALHLACAVEAGADYYPGKEVSHAAAY